MKKGKKIVCLLLVMVLAATMFAGCEAKNYEGGREEKLTYEEATRELSANLTKIKVTEIQPRLDIYDSSETSTVLLADIDTFPITVQGRGQINLEIAAATEFSSESPDDWLNVIAERFNRAGYQVNGRSVSVSVRKITSGEVLTYMADGNYRPNLYIPSSAAWGKMLEAKGFEVKTLSDRIAGNTAGILMEKDTYADFTEKYGDVTVDKVLEASLMGDLTFAYTNPYTSSTGLNILTAMLSAFDPENPLSGKAQEKLLDYQKKSPPVAYTTAVLRNQAAKGIIKAMVMEEQAYVNKPELRDYVYTPAGIRHDHPVYAFDYLTKDELEAAQIFVDYCEDSDSQKLATEKGFNLHDDYVGKDSGLDGAGYLAAQRIWKQSKDGGRPIIATFVADVSGSMNGLPLNSLKSSLLSSINYIGEDHCVGLVSYSDNVFINLPIGQFDSTARAYFSGAVKDLTANGGTATYDAVLVALNMLLEKQKEIPDAKLMLFVLSDGAQNVGASLDRITGIVAGLNVPIYTIGYNLKEGSATSELQKLSNINEAALINASSDDIVTHLRNLFNVQL